MRNALFALALVPLWVTLPAAGQSQPAPDAKTRAADVTGTWKSEFDSQVGHQKYTFTFKQEGAKLTGKANSQVEDRKREAELKEGKVEGDAISFAEMLTIQPVQRSR